MDFLNKWCKFQTPIPDQDGPEEGTLTQLEMFSTKEIAHHITAYDWDLFISIHEVKNMSPM